MGDIEVHEHVVVDGSTVNLKHALLHENVETLSRYIAKHNEYSNWEVQGASARRRTGSRVTPDFVRERKRSADAG